jgi:polyphosphate kinase 2 (PPK2 family)
MLEKVNLGLSCAKEEYQQVLPGLQKKLFELEHAVFKAGIPVAIVFEGWAAAGKGSTIRVLTQRLDPRAFRVVPVTPPRTAEKHYPWLRRFWLKIPAYGQIVIFDTSWYRRVLISRIRKQVRKKEWQAAYQDISEFENQLAADGTVIRKFWLHISREEQVKRQRKLLKDKLTSWRVTEEDALQSKKYGKYLTAVEEMLARTDTPHAPWVIVEATDRYHTRIKVMEETVKVLEAALKGPLRAIPPGRKGGTAPHRPVRRRKKASA